MRDVPPLVQRALAEADRLGFAGSCRPETGRLLRALASQYRGGTLAELGTGCGVGAAWLLDGLRHGGRLVTVEHDVDRAAAASRLFEAAPHVDVLRAEWQAVLEFGPFELVFCDVASAKHEGAQTVLESVRPGGLVVLDDFTPGFAGADPVRDFWLHADGLIGVELMVAADHSVVVSVRD